MTQVPLVMPQAMPRGQHSRNHRLLLPLAQPKLPGERPWRRMKGRKASRVQRRGLRWQEQSLEGGGRSRSRRRSRQGREEAGETSLAASVGAGVAAGEKEGAREAAAAAAAAAAAPASRAGSTRRAKGRAHGPRPGTDAPLLRGTSSGGGDGVGTREGAESRGARHKVDGCSPRAGPCSAGWCDRSCTEGPRLSSWHLRTRSSRLKTERHRPQRLVSCLERRAGAREAVQEGGSQERGKGGPGG